MTRQALGQARHSVEVRVQRDLSMRGYRLIIEGKEIFLPEQVLADAPPVWVNPDPRFRT